MGRSLPLILNLTAASSLALCTASRHTPTRFYLCAAPSLHRSCCCPSPRSISHLSQTSQGCGSSASSGFKSCSFSLLCKLTPPAIVLFKTFDFYQGKSSRSFFVRLTFDARYVVGDRDVNLNDSRQYADECQVHKTIVDAHWINLEKISHSAATTKTSILHTAPTNDLSHLDTRRSSAIANIRLDLRHSNDIPAQQLHQNRRSIGSVTTPRSQVR